MPGKAITLTASLHLLKASILPLGLTHPELFLLSSPSSAQPQYSH